MRERSRLNDGIAGYDGLPGVIDLPGIGVGSITDRVKETGVTVILLPQGATGAVDVAGGAPATRETPVLDPTNMVRGPDAVVLSGGSALGLQAADGVANGLRGLGRGVMVGSVRIPIVVAAAIFDMDQGLSEPPLREDGEEALRRALRFNTTVQEGRCGAGTGATVGKTLGPFHRMYGGQGAVTLATPDGLRVAALVVVNAVGSVLDEHQAILAGPRVNGTPQSTVNLWATENKKLEAGGATTIGIVMTNAGLSKSELGRVARMSHDGLARAIDPVHTAWDGDTLFAVSVGDRDDDVSRVGAIAAHAVAQAVRRAVRVANGNEESVG